MTITQVAAVLAKVQLGDNRDIDAKGLVLAEWEDAIGDLDFAEAIEAVRMHRKFSTDYLMPAHIVANVKLIRRRQERAERIQRQSQRAIEPQRITLDREEFERLTQAAIERHRAERGVA